MRSSSKESNHSTTVWSKITINDRQNVSSNFLVCWRTFRLYSPIGGLLGSCYWNIIITVYTPHILLHVFAISILERLWTISGKGEIFGRTRWEPYHARWKVSIAFPLRPSQSIGLPLCVTWAFNFVMKATIANIAVLWPKCHPTRGLCAGYCLMLKHPYMIIPRKREADVLSEVDESVSATNQSVDKERIQTKRVSKTANCFVQSTESRKRKK